MPSEKVAGALERLGVDVPAEDLAHYGVPGMKWGQRKASDSGSSSSSSKKPVDKVTKVTAKAVSRSDSKEIKKIAKDDAKTQAGRLKGVSRIVRYDGDAKKAKRASTRAMVGNILRGSLLVGGTAGVLTIAGISAPALVVGAGVIAGLSATGQMSRTLSEIRNVNSASEVFKPNTLLSRTNG